MRKLSRSGDAKFPVILAIGCVLSYFQAGAWYVEGGFGLPQSYVCPLCVNVDGVWVYPLWHDISFTLVFGTINWIALLFLIGAVLLIRSLTLTLARKLRPQP